MKFLLSSIFEYISKYTTYASQSRLITQWLQSKTGIIFSFLTLFPFFLIGLIQTIEASTTLIVIDHIDGIALKFLIFFAFISYIFYTLFSLVSFVAYLKISRSENEALKLDIFLNGMYIFFIFIFSVYVTTSVLSEAFEVSSTHFSFTIGTSGFIMYFILASQITSVMLGIGLMMQVNAKLICFFRSKPFSNSSNSLVTWIRKNDKAFRDHVTSFEKVMVKFSNFLSLFVTKEAMQQAKKPKPKLRSLYLIIFQIMALKGLLLFIDALYDEKTLVNSILTSAKYIDFTRVEICSEERTGDNKTIYYKSIGDGLALRYSDDTKELTTIKCTSDVRKKIRL